MKKRTGYILVIVLLSMILTGCGQGKLADCFDKEALEKQAKEDIELSMEGDFDTFAERFDERTKTAIDAESYQSQYLDTIAKKGAFKSVGNMVVVGQKDEKSGEDFAAVVAVVKFADGDIRYTLGYTENMELVSFLIK